MSLSICKNLEDRAVFLTVYIKKSFQNPLELWTEFGCPVYRKARHIFLAMAWVVEDSMEAVL